MVLAIWLKVSREVSWTTALDIIEHELNHLGDVADFINIASMAAWQRMILTAFTLFTCDRQVISEDMNLVDSNNVVRLHEGDTKLFLSILIHYQSRLSQYPIRGPDGFAWDFYQQSGGSDQCAPFLFGTASQHRR
jgi:hypothetical protein